MPIERHPKKIQNVVCEKFCSAGIVYRRVLQHILELTEGENCCLLVTFVAELFSVSPRVTSRMLADCMTKPLNILLTRSKTLANFPLFLI